MPWKRGNMKLIVKPVGGGKTTELIRMADGCNGYIVCRGTMVSEIAERAQRLECKINYPISYYEFISMHYHGKGVKCFYVDDIDALVSSMTPVPVKAMTVTDDYDRKELKEIIEMLRYRVNTDRQLNNERPWTSVMTEAANRLESLK